MLLNNVGRPVPQFLTLEQDKGQNKTQTLSGFKKKIDAVKFDKNKTNVI